MHLGGSVPRSSWSVHVGNELSGASYRPAAFYQIPLGLPSYFPRHKNFFFSRALGNRASSIEWRTARDKRLEYRVEKRREGDGILYGWLNETRTYYEINMSVVPSSFNSVFPINTVVVLVFRANRSSFERTGWGGGRGRVLKSQGLWITVRKSMPLANRLLSETIFDEDRWESFVANLCVSTLISLRAEKLQNGTVFY